LDRKLYQCKIFLSNMKSETNAQLKRQQLTGHGYQIINYDTTQYFALRLSSHRQSGRGDEWVRVSAASMARGARKHTSAKQRGEESSLNGMTVKWTDATTASGMVFPMTMEFDGFSESEMPKSEFLFLSVAGLSINGHLDARQHKACGYVVLKRKGVSLEKFHAWYTHRVIGDYFK
jgi:hypothetical protein